ncbi:MAG TPA: hypothetical protein VLC46_17110 [Thermoanaerobaculia bacterium]|jgi:hypothetical protein|nr:hypothetical protein [Thermoanaerobaculia bacterium]
MKTLRLVLASLLLFGIAAAAVPSSINNDDSCDIKVGPAATLLLPYFEVDVSGNSGQTTLFTITNVTRYPQIAHVTLWSDWAYPVMTFNAFLTGYDVQAINLADVLIRGIIAPPSGTSSATKPGSLSASTNPNLLDCASNPGSVPASIIAGVRNALTSGVFNPGGGVNACSTAGGAHANAIGYATIDVVANCTNLLPSDPKYYTTDLLFDNVLIGDYQQLGGSPAGTGVPSAFDAAGNPMVHIRAVPEGGGAGSNAGTALPYTFYDRYTPAATRTIDRRQPLPSTFAVRFIQGGTNALATNLTIWREGITGAGAPCASHVNNAALTFGEIVRFDEHENPFTFAPDAGCLCRLQPPVLPATSSTASSSSEYPEMDSADVGGWLYLNLDNGGSTTYSVTHDVGGVATPTNTRTSLTPVGSTTTLGPRPSQNWVTVTMFGNLAGNRMTAAFDAASLGNGCTPAAFPAVVSPAFNGVFYGVPIGPAGGVFVCPPGTTLTDGTTTLCTGTNGNQQP